jgi:cytochrome c oxidase subunit 2
MDRILSAGVPASIRIAMSTDTAARAERRWAAICIGILVLLMAMAAYGGIHQAVMPQTVVETIDPRTLHIGGEFAEANLGSALEADGTVTVRAIGQQYSFTPQCILVPADTAITIRATSADVLHGLMIEHTNVNAMLVPGYISTVTTRFPVPAQHAVPCHEFCGIGHEGMWGRLIVIPRAKFVKMAADRRRLSCVAQ